MAHKRSKAGASSVANNGGNSDEKEVSEVRFNVGSLFPSIITAILAVSGLRPTFLYYLTRSDLLLHRLAHPFRDDVREFAIDFPPRKIPIGFLLLQSDSFLHI